MLFKSSLALSIPSSTNFTSVLYFEADKQLKVDFCGEENAARTQTSVSCTK